VIPDEGVAEIEAEYETAGTVVLDHATDVERRIEAVRPFRSRERCSWPAFVKVRPGVLFFSKDPFGV